MRRQLFHCSLAVLLGLVLAALLLWLRTVAPVGAVPDVRPLLPLTVVPSPTRYVAPPPTGSDAGNQCTDPGNPCATVQHAVDVAQTGDEIHVAGGTYTRTGTVASITRELGIIGAFDPAFSGSDPELYETVLDADWGGSVISITNADDVLLLHLTLTHGDGTGNCGSDGCGGGIYATGTNLHVGHCVITDNVGSTAGGSMGWGGGIYAYASNRHVDVWNSQIVSNTANTDPSSFYYSYGGGIHIHYGTASLVENQVLHNVGSAAGTGGMGGGIFLYGVTQADVLTNTIRGNEATAHSSGGDGGGIYIFGFKAHVASNLIEDNWTAPNWAGSGGGVYVSSQTEAHLTRNTIISNATLPPGTGWVAPGGGVCIRSSDPVTLSNNLIARNTASDSDGGGVYVDHGAPAGPVLLVNNIIADNGATGVVGWQNVVITLTNNLIAGHDVGITVTVPASATISADTNLFWNTSDPIVGNNAILEHPRLASDYHLRDGSPAVNAGLTISWLTTDLEGNPRPPGEYDIGAYEGVKWEVFLPLVLRGG